MLVCLENRRAIPFFCVFSEKTGQVKQSKRRNEQKGRQEVVEIEGINKVKKVLKKVLTKRGESGRIMKLSRRAAARYRKKLS